jgi:hypothetical protein
VTNWHLRILNAYVRLDDLFFNEFLKHVPIIHPVLGRQRIAEDDQLAAIACALGSLAADDVQPGYMCTVWIQTYQRVSAKAVRSLGTTSFHTYRQFSRKPGQQGACLIFFWNFVSSTPSKYFGHIQIPWS